MTMLKTKIVCTLGPSSENKYVIKQLIIAGMNIARINLSHGNHEEHRKESMPKKGLRRIKCQCCSIAGYQGAGNKAGNFYGGKVLLNKVRNLSSLPPP